MMRLQLEDEVRVQMQRKMRQRAVAPTKAEDYRYEGEEELYKELREGERQEVLSKVATLSRNGERELAMLMDSLIIGEPEERSAQDILHPASLGEHSMVCSIIHAR